MVVKKVFRGFEQLVYMQQIGRLLRPVYERNVPLDTTPQRLRAISRSSKPHAIILDHAGNAFRHGLVGDVREWTLDAKKRKRSTSLAVKMCPNFHYCKVWQKTCHICGHIFIVVPVERKINTRDGELVKLGAVMVRQLRRREESRARTYQELVSLGKQRGYHPMWAYKRFVERGGDPAKIS